MVRKRGDASSIWERMEKAMKVCKYCGVDNANSAATCSSCGANDFSNRCDNCGTVFEDGNYCPKCGVKAGKESKVCPDCGTVYYTAVCPECGRKDGTRRSANAEYTIYTPVQKADARPEAKRRTWLWALGWIFIFPVPLTILMARNRKLNKWVKAGIIAAAWIVYLAIGFSGSGAAANDSMPGSGRADPAASAADVQPADAVRENAADSFERNN